MKRVYNVNRLGNHKRIFILDKRLSLKKGPLLNIRKNLFGVGNYSFTKLLTLTGVSIAIRKSCDRLALPLYKLNVMTDVGRKILYFEKDLKMLIKQNIVRKIKNGSYVGRRHRLGLPTKGQRTHTNARTAKKLLRRA